MHNHLGWLPSAGRYILVDKYPETLHMYKKLIEEQEQGMDVLYIADSSMCLPLKEGCIDLHLDFFAANEHNFYHHSFLYNEMQKFMAKDARLVGTYFYFENGRKSMKNLLAQYPEAYEKNFDRDQFLAEMERSGYRLLQWEEKGEEMHLMPYMAERLLKKS